MRFLLLLAMTLVWLMPADAQSPSVQFTAISYNVQFLPGMASAANKRKQPEYRASRIAQEVAAFDIVALQETFNEVHRPILIDALRTAWNGTVNLVVAPKPDGFYANGGTMLATRYPILETHSCVYSQFSKPEDYGISADGYAAKGAIHARLQLSDGGVLDVFDTHFEAREPKFRPSQYREFADFIAAHTDSDTPAVLFGDMNTNGVESERNNPDSEYHVLISELERAHPSGRVVDVWPQLHPDETGGTSEQESTEIGKRIDYLIVLDPGDGATSLTPLSIQIEPFPDATVGYLSDHSAVIGRFALKP